jgi:hypothetical protein
MRKLVIFGVFDEMELQQKYRRRAQHPLEHRHCLHITAFMLWRQYWRHFWGSFFTGAYLPQKSVLSPPIESQYKPFQKHVSSYWVERSPGCVVWAAPTLLRDEPFLIMEEQPLSTLTRGAESNPARVLWREVCHD